jgi:hypothetical protein
MNQVRSENQALERNEKARNFQSGRSDSPSVSTAFYRGRNMSPSSSPDSAEPSSPSKCKSCNLVGTTTSSSSPTELQMMQAQLNSMSIGYLKRMIESKRLSGHFIEKSDLVAALVNHKRRQL